MAPKVGRASLLALHHPWLVAGGSGLVIVVLGLANRMSLVASAVSGAIIVAIQIAIWVPDRGVARRYALRLLAEQDEGTQEKG